MVLYLTIVCIRFFHKAGRARYGLTLHKNVLTLFLEQINLKQHAVPKSYFDPYIGLRHRFPGKVVNSVIPFLSTSSEKIVINSPTIIVCLSDCGEVGKPSESVV